MFHLPLNVDGNCMCPWYSHRWGMRLSEFLQTPDLELLGPPWPENLGQVLGSLLSPLSSKWNRREFIWERVNERQMAIYCWGQWSDKLILRAAGRDLLCVNVSLLAALTYWGRDKCFVERRIFRRCYKEEESVWCRSSSRTVRQRILCVTVWCNSLPEICMVPQCPGRHYIQKEEQCDMDQRKSKSSAAFYFTLKQKYLETNKNLREKINLEKGQAWLNIQHRQQKKGSLHHNVLGELALKIASLLAS